MTPHAALMHLSLHRSAAGDRAGHLTVCARCRESLLDDLDSHFTAMEPPVIRSLEGSQIMGFTLSDGPRDTCALHALLHEEDAHE